MPRIRSIKPEFFTDDAVGALSLPARLLFVGTWVFADDYGTLDRSAKQLKAQVFPYDDVDCDPLLAELLAAGLLAEYQADGKTYLYITGFADHQKIDKPSKAKRPLPEDSITRRTLTEDSANTRSGREGKGREGNGGEDSPPGLDAVSWKRWTDYRTQIRRPLKPVSIPAAQRELAAFGAEQAAVVEQSIAHGWQGLFALKPKASGSAPKRERPPTETEIAEARKRAAAENADVARKLGLPTLAAMPP